MTASGPVVVWFRRDLRLHDHPALTDALVRPAGRAAVRLRPTVASRTVRVGQPGLVPARIGRGASAGVESRGGRLFVRAGDARGGGPRVRRRSRCRRCVRQPGLHTLRTATGPRGGGRLGGARRATPRQARPARPRARRRARTIRLVVRCLQPVPPTLGGTPAAGRPARSSRDHHRRCRRGAATRALRPWVRRSTAAEGALPEPPKLPRAAGSRRGSRLTVRPLTTGRATGSETTMRHRTSVPTSGSVPLPGRGRHASACLGRRRRGIAALRRRAGLARLLCARAVGRAALRARGDGYPVPRHHVGGRSRRSAAWQRGRTGYPIVDAAMRQLSAAGWIPNRARMISASFLTKDLLIDWRVGERHFMTHLVDGDPASNLGGWQWAASVGTDSRPFVRIFNPVIQAKRFDPDGVYVRTWLPELADVPTRRIHEPWTMSPDEQESSHCRIGVDYPAPIIDHGEARQRALARYAPQRPRRAEATRAEPRRPGSPLAVAARRAPIPSRSPRATVRGHHASS